MPAWFAVLASRVRALFQRRRLDLDFDEELQAHVALLTEDNVRRGMTPIEARRAALLRLGGPTQLRERHAEQRGVPQIETLLQDLRYGIRTCLKSPAFTAVAVLTLALGIGANTLIFSVVSAIFLKPMPYSEPDRLVNVWESRTKEPDRRNIVSAPDFLDWQRQNHVFESMALFDSAGKGYNLGGGKEPERVRGLRVTASLFPMLGVNPYLGRTFLPGEDTLGRHRVVVLSYGLWKRRYAADPAQVGRNVRIDGENYTVVGVMPARFEFTFWGGRNELWVPVAFDAGDKLRTSNSFVACARLKRGVTLERAAAEMDAIGRGLAQQYPESNIGESVSVRPMNEVGVKDLRPTFIALFAAVGFVLLIACVNVANLMLARGAVRNREFAIRRALGAGRLRIVRQLLTESLLLSLAGGGAGLLIALAGTRLFDRVVLNYFGFIPFRQLEHIGIDTPVLLFTLLVSFLAAALFGLVAAFGVLRGNVNTPLKEGTGRGSTARSGRLRHALVASEVGLALVVLMGAGLMIESMSRLMRIDPGIDVNNVLTMSVSLPQEVIYYSPPVRANFCRDLEERVGALPGVLSVGAISHLPIGGGGAGRGFVIEGRPDSGPENRPGGGYALACPNYFRTMGIPLIAGREFTHQDTVNAPGVVVINQAMARRFWSKEDPIGRRFRITGSGPDEPWLTIVGVSRDVRHDGLDQQPYPEFARPYTQAAWPVMTVVVKTASAPGAFSRPVQNALLQLDPDQAASGVATMQEVVHDSLSSRRLPTLLLGAFALLALTLAAIGISGVVSYSVAQRTHEIGIRMALGAGTAGVARMVVSGSMRWAAAGVVAGAAGSLALTRVLGGLLFDVRPMDPAVLGVAAGVLTAVALLASYVPARRAARVDPIVALRCD